MWWKALEDEELLMTLTMARLIWLRRNDVVFGRVFSPPSNLVQVADRMVGEFNIAVQKGLEGVSNQVLQNYVGQQRGQSNQVHGWNPSPVNYKKINWDAALDPMQKKTGIRVVIRDERGGFYAAQAWFFPFLLEPTIAEAWGA